MPGLGKRRLKDGRVSGPSRLAIAAIALGDCQATSWEVQGSHQEGTVMCLCPAGLGGSAVWLRPIFLILLVFGVLKLGCSVTTSQTSVLDGCKLTVPDCSSGWGESTLSC